MSRLNSGLLETKLGQGDLNLYFATESEFCFNSSHNQI